MRWQPIPKSLRSTNPCSGVHIEFDESSIVMNSVKHVLHPAFCSLFSYLVCAIAFV